MTIEDYSQAIGVPMASLLGRSRKMEISIARQFYWYHARFVAKLSVMYLARIFGRGHSSIINGINRVNNMIAVNDPIISRFKQFIG